MKQLILIPVLVLILNINLFSSPEEIVQKSLEAYNNRNLEKFMTYFSDDIEMYSFECEQTAKGYDNVKKLYKALFDSSPNLHSKILNRTVIGNKVIDHEYITGRRGSDEAIEIVFIYVIENDKIVKTMLIRP